MTPEARRAFLAVGEVLAVVLLALAAAIVPVVALAVAGAAADRPVTLHLAPHPGDESGERLAAEVAQRFPGAAARAAAQADAVELVVSGREGPVPAPVELAELARARGWEVRGFERGALSGGLEEPSAGLVLVVQFVVFMTAGVLARRLLCRGELPPRRHSPAVLVGYGVLAAVVLLTGSVALEQLLRRLGVPFSEQAWILDLVERGGAELLWIAPLVMILAPVAEEVLFRGYVFERLRQRAGVGLAYGVSAGIFAVIHLNPPGMVIYAFLGLVLAAAYHRTGSLLVPIVAHVVNNSLAFGLLLIFGPP